MKNYYTHVFLDLMFLKYLFRDGGERDTRTAYLSSDSLKRQLRWTDVHSSVWPEIGWNWPVLPNRWQTLYLPLQLYMQELILFLFYSYLKRLYECYNKNFNSFLQLFSILTWMWDRIWTALDTELWFFGYVRRYWNIVQKQKIYISTYTSDFNCLLDFDPHF